MIAQVKLGAYDNSTPSTTIFLGNHLFFFPMMIWKLGILSFAPCLPLIIGIYICIYKYINYHTAQKTRKLHLNEIYQLSSSRTCIFDCRDSRYENRKSTQRNLPMSWAYKFSVPILFVRTWRIFFLIRYQNAQETESHSLLLNFFLQKS